MRRSVRLFALPDPLLCVCVCAGCSTAVNDLVYIVDGSWSVGFSDFDTAKQWLINITSQFDISSHYTQVTREGRHLPTVHQSSLGHNPVTWEQDELSYLLGGKHSFIFNFIHF